MFIGAIVLIAVITIELNAKASPLISETGANEEFVELIPVGYFANTTANNIPEGFVVMYGEEERNSSSTYTQGPRMHEFAAGGDFTRALYFREGYVEYGSVANHLLSLEAGKKYYIRFNTAMWKDNGSRTRFQIFFENDEDAVLTQMIDNKPNVNGSKGAVNGSTFTRIIFAPQNTGNYRIRWTSANNETENPGFYEILLANPKVTCIPNEATLPDVTRRSVPRPQTMGFVKSSSTDDYYYLYNTGAGKFFTEGNNWGTQASVGDKGLKVAFTEVSDGVYNLQNLSLKKEGWYPVFIYNDQKLFVDGVKTNCITNGDLSSNDFGCFKSKEAASDILDVTIGEGLGPNSGRAIVVTSADNPSEVWDTQFFILGKENLAAGSKFHVEFDYKASKNATASTQVHGEPGSYIHWEAIGNVNFTTEWQHYSADITVTDEMADMKTIAFNLSEEGTATTYYFSNIVFESRNEWDFSIQNNGATFRIYGAETNPTYKASVYPNKYVGLDLTSDPNNTSLSPLLEEGTGHCIDWTLVSPKVYDDSDEMALFLKSEELYSYFIKMEENGLDYSSWIPIYENEDATEEDLSAAINEIKVKLLLGGEDIIDIHVDEPGTLGDLILERVENFTDVVGLRVSGCLNDVDLTNLKSRLTNVKYLDMEETDVTVIPNELFRDHWCLLEMRLPKGLVSIGEYAFYNCNSMNSLIFPSTLRTIEDYAFYDCFSFEEVIIPEGVETIGMYAFSVSAIGKRRKYQNGEYIEFEPQLEKVSLPSTLRTLGGSAFYYCNSIKTLNIADGLEQIEQDAFSMCHSLRELRLPSTLKIIGSYAFYWSALSTVELPEELNSIGYNAFSQCVNLREVVLPSTLTDVSQPFANCNQLTKMTLKTIVPPSTNNYNVMDGNESQCTLTVSRLTASVYKQTAYWDQFKIIGDDIYPESITINTEYKLSWPNNLDYDYKPMFRVENTGRLEILGSSTLSASYFTMVYDENLDYWYNMGQRNSNATAISSSLINKAIVRADNVIIDLWAHTDKWTFFSLPFDIKVSNIGSFYPETPFAIRKYDGLARSEDRLTETWIPMTADSTLHAGEGYVVQSPGVGSRDWYGFWFIAEQNVNKNNIFKNEDIEIVLKEYQSEFPQNRSWNFIGNPYPCYYDTRAINVSAPITVWNTYNSNYEAYSPIDDQLILRPNEPFFIQCPLEKSSLIFLKEGRQLDYHVRDINYFATSRQNCTLNRRSVFNIELSNGKYSDRTRFVINQQAQMDYEIQSDASKFISVDAGIQIYTIEKNLRFAINERPMAEGVVAVGLQITEKGGYTLRLDTQVENEVYLIDQLTGTEVLLDEQGYDFDSEAGTFDNRFEIRLGNGDVTGIRTVDSSIKKNEYYNLNGVRIQQPKKGININNGKKVVVQ